LFDDWAQSRRRTQSGLRPAYAPARSKVAKARAYAINPDNRRDPGLEVDLAQSIIDDLLEIGRKTAAS
jgi:hypothetical protein